MKHDRLFQGEKIAFCINPATPTLPEFCLVTAVSGTAVNEGTLLCQSYMDAHTDTHTRGRERAAKKVLHSGGLLLTGRQHLKQQSLLK